MWEALWSASPPQLNRDGRWGGAALLAGALLCSQRTALLRCGCSSNKMLEHMLNKTAATEDPWVRVTPCARLGRSRCAATRARFAMRARAATRAHARADMTARDLVGPRARGAHARASAHAFDRARPG